MKKLYKILLISIFISNCYAQTDFGRANSYFNFRLSGYLVLHGKGTGGISASFGTWKELVMGGEKFCFRSQPGFNLSGNFVIGQDNLGNRSRYKTRYQFNLVASPLFTIGSNRRGMYEEIAPFYFGNANSVYANYKGSLTIGTNFVLMPQGVRRNIGTFRNRTQQLIYIGFRVPLCKNGIQNFQFNIYEDFLGFTNKVQGFADNFDRFYTGGGNAQIRFSENIKTKFYSEIYTGNFNRDMFDYPDLYLPDEYLIDKKGKGISTKFKHHRKGDSTYNRHPRFVAQEPGQKIFNIGRSFFEVEVGANSNHLPDYYTLKDSEFKKSYSRGSNPYTISGYFGWQGGHKQMKVQNNIHNFDTIDKINLNIDSDPLDTLNIEKGNKKKFERLHHFYPSYENGEIIYGLGTSLNILYNN